MSTWIKLKTLSHERQAIIKTIEHARRNEWIAGVAAARTVGFAAGGALLVGAYAGFRFQVPRRPIAATMAFGSGVLISVLAMPVDAMIPEAFEGTHDVAGLITVSGFLAAFALSKLG